MSNRSSAHHPSQADDGHNIEALALRDALARSRPLARARHRGLRGELRHHGTDLWLSLSRQVGGGLALRLPLLAPGSRIELGHNRADCLIALEAQNEVARFAVELRAGDPSLEYLRWHVRITPRQDLHIPYLPRDLIAFGTGGDPRASAGTVEASQRRLNTGLVYCRFTAPALGKVLYLQDFTELNDYFAATGTKPESVVGGAWPVLGYLPPVAATDPGALLRQGQTYTLYATHLVFRAKPEEDERESAWQFLDMLATVYGQLPEPATTRRDWVGRARRTLADLNRSAKLRQRHGDHIYFRPYVDAEQPDSMVQLAILTGLHDWGRWTGRRPALVDSIPAGLERFYDPRLRTLRRYLPDVTADKNPDAVDSWYLYHPLLNLATLALAGEDWARDLFLRSVGYGVKAARHFAYRWPIQYDVKDFSVITAVSEADQRGQTDVGGIYAWVMLLAFRLTDDAQYLAEAKAAIGAAEGMRFNLNYQANLTAWGAVACVQLWRLTNDKSYLAQSYVYLASFFHNSQMWESEIGWAAHYNTFLGVTCLQDAPYMAMYECYDSFVALEHYLDLGGPDLLPSVRLLLTAYCRHALHRAWWYYPDTLPPAALATASRNGAIDRRLSIPVEDLYPDGQPAGQVGQETYGAAAAMIFATRSHHRVPGAPFLLFCDHFVRAFTRIDERTLSLSVDGVAATRAEVRVLRQGRAALPEIQLRNWRGETIEPTQRDAQGTCWTVEAGSALLLSW